AWEVPVAPFQIPQQAPSIVRADGSFDRRSGSEPCAPARELRLAGEDAEVLDGIKDVEIAKHRAEHGINERETVTVEPRCRQRAGLEPAKPTFELSPLGVEGCRVGRGVKSPDIVEDGRTVFDQGAVLGAS